MTTSNEVLTRPTAETAARLLREVAWGEQLEGVIFGSGPGSETERMFKLVEVYHLLMGMPSFTVDYELLARWLEQTLGDAELATRVRDAAQECGDPEASPGCPDGARRAAGKGPPEGARARNEDPEKRLRKQVIDLLGLRVTQCREALSPDRSV